MKLKFNRTSELEVVGFGIYEPKKEVEVSDEFGKMMLDTGYFDEVREIREKEKKIKIKKSKKKGDNLLCQ